jgi:hypothetical protein
MKRTIIALAAVLCLAGPAAAAPTPDWSMNATVIEACSCPMFCQCYFNAEPAGHSSHAGAEEHFCRFNNAYKINRGAYGDVKLDGALFWLSGDLGDSFTDAEMDWAVVTFDKKLTPPQREAIGTVIVPHLFPVKWKKVTTAEGEITWTASKDEAKALLDAGKSAEVNLKRFPGMTEEPVVIKNLKYWGAPRNDGFVMMPSSLHAYRVGDKPYEFRNSNGFMITIDIDSKTAPPLPGADAPKSGGSKSY